MTQIPFEKSLKIREKLEAEGKVKTQTTRQKLDAVNKWIVHLEHDKNVYEIVLNDILGGNQPKIHMLEELFGFKLTKHNPPSPEQFRFVRRVETELSSEKYFSPDIVAFVHNLEYLVQEMRKHGVNVSVQERFLQSKHLEHARKYHDEISYLRTHLSNLTKSGEEKTWAYFRNEFYANKERIEKEISERFSDENFANFLKQYLAKQKENREGVINVLTKVVTHMESSKGINDVEKRAIQELHKAVQEHLEGLKEILETIRTRTLKGFEKEQKVYRQIIATDAISVSFSNLFEKEDELLKKAIAMKSEFSEDQTKILDAYAQYSQLKKTNAKLRLQKNQADPEQRAQFHKQIKANNNQILALKMKIRKLWPKAEKEQIILKGLQNGLKDVVEDTLKESEKAV